jgi:hypothetical protein
VPAFHLWTPNRSRQKASSSGGASIVEQAGIPAPEVNATLELEGRRIEVDFLWRRERLGTDGASEVIATTRAGLAI